jgi:hypothetical protein
VCSCEAGEFIPSLAQQRRNVGRIARSGKLGEESERAFRQGWRALGKSEYDAGGDEGEGCFSAKYEVIEQTHRPILQVRIGHGPGRRAFVKQAYQRFGASFGNSGNKMSTGRVELAHAP